jgi:vanillate O-demethylase ferredoxin subunit
MIDNLNRVELWATMAISSDNNRRIEGVKRSGDAQPPTPEDRGQSGSQRAPSPETTLTVRIVQKRLEAEDIVSLLLHGEDLPPFKAGAHIEVQLPGALTRQYSLCSGPDDPHVYEIAVLREPTSRGGSKAVHDVLQVGQFIEISTPRNLFPLDATASRTLLLAGGIGVTPILSMANECARENRAFEMHYCARTPAKMAFADRLKRSPIAPHCHLHFDDGPRKQQIDLARVLANPRVGHHLYVCGPSGFINATLDTAAASGWADAQLHREFFSAPASEHDEGDDKAFTVALARSGLQTEVPPGVSIVKALEDIGVFVPTSCAEGICGMCVVPVLEGIPEHRDFILSADERARNDRLTACCSRAKTPMLVLDL